LSLSGEARPQAWAESTRWTKEAVAGAARLRLWGEESVSELSNSRIGRLFGHPDRLSGAVLSLLAVVALIEAASLPYGTVRAPDAGFFPKTLAALLLFFGLGIVFNSFLTKAHAVQFTTRSWQVAIAAAAFIAYALVLQKAGFVIATIALMLLVMRGLGGMSWKQSLLITVPGVMLSYIAFVQLGVPLPRGPLPY
jgi:putative tricarboxylic transport membrane protein